MAVRRQKNWLGQQRVDTTHLREVESGVVGDFDDLAGKILASSRAIVLHGMNISMAAAVGNFATQLVLNTASSILLHGTASEPGSLFVVSPEQAAETLNTSNPNVVGSFTPNAINYIGIDLIRQADPTTSDIVKFRSATTQKEFSQQVPLARTLQYRVIVSTSDFDLLTNVAPVAKVQLDVNGIVQSVTDCRQMLFRLGTGGSVPNPLGVFGWPGGRTENPVTSTSTSDPFVGADKSIASFIDFFHAMESRLWEVGGGEHWYSQTTDRDVLFVRDPAQLFVSDNENFEWTGTNLHWKGLSFDFGNSTAVKNTINNQLVDQSGLTDLAIGQCLYVDLNRAVDNSALTMVKANLANIGTPTIPGSRHIIAYRVSEGIFGLGSPYPVGFAFPHATTLAYGVVKMFSDPGTTATVAGVDTNGYVNAHGITRDTSGVLHIGPNTNTFDTEVDISASGILTRIFGSLTVDQGILSNTTIVNGNGVTATANGSGVGVIGNGGATNGQGVQGVGGGAGAGVFGQGGVTNGIGVSGLGIGSGAGVRGAGGNTNGIGVIGLGAAGGAGVAGTGGSSGIGVTGLGLGSAAGGSFTGGNANGVGVVGTGTGSGTGVSGTGGATDAAGVTGFGGGANGIAVLGQGVGGGAGVEGRGGATAPGVQARGNFNRAALNLRVQARPATAVQGDIYFDTNDLHLYVWRGALWSQLDN